MMKLLLSLASVLLVSQAVWAQRVEFDKVFQRGSGCLTENTEVQLARTEINILFKSFVTVLEPFVRSSTALTDCKITAKIRVPQGYALVLRGAVFEGVYSLSEEAKSTFHSELILDGQDHDASSFMLKGNSSNNFYHDSNKYVREMVGDCGGVSTVQFNSSMFIRSKVDDRRFISKSQLNSISIPYQILKCNL